LKKDIGRELIDGPDEDYPLAGVVADFYECSFHQATWPVIIKHDPRMESVIAILKLL
jgi:putative ABC transport system permease protein